MKANSLLLGFIVGGLAAGITTLLTAPASGKETRKYVSDNKDAWINQISEIEIDLSEIKNSIITLSLEGKEGLTAFIRDVKTLVSDWQTDIKPHQEQIQNDIQSIQETIQELERTMELQRS